MHRPLCERGARKGGNLVKSAFRLANLPPPVGASVGGGRHTVLRPPPHAVLTAARCACRVPGSGAAARAAIAAGQPPPPFDPTGGAGVKLQRPAGAPGA